MLEVDDLEIGYRSKRGATSVAKHLNLRINAGEFVCLLGPNGAGKSTLMRTIAGMQAPLGGKVALDGADIRTLTPNQRAARLSVVLTERVTAGLLTCYAMVCLGRFPHTGWFGKLSEEDHEAVRRALRLAGAEAFSSRLVGELSDGERQRVMMARALAQDPRLMILDEITAFLDLPRRIEMMQFLRDLAGGGERSILISSHDLDLALRTADYVWLMRGDGTLVTGGPEDLVLDGSFASAFADEGLKFDPLRGGFDLRRQGGAIVSVIGGDAVQREWTLRALERNGFQALEENQSTFAGGPFLELIGRSCWRLQFGGLARTFDTLYDLVRELKSFDLDPCPQAS